MILCSNLDSDGKHSSQLPHQAVDIITKHSKFPIDVEGICLKNAPDVEFRQYFYATIEIDGKEQVRTSLADNEWHHIKCKKDIQLEARYSSIFCLRLYLHRKFHGPIFVGVIETAVHLLLSHPEAISRGIPWPGHLPGAEGNMMEISFTLKHAHATIAEQLINDIRTLAYASQTGDSKHGSDRLMMVTRGMSDSYPSAKTALGVLSVAYNIFLVEDDHGKHLRDLLDIVCETHTLASEASSSTPHLYEEPLRRLSRYAADCGYFIREFVAKKGILHNLVNRVTSIDVDAELKGYIRKFEQLRSCFSKSGAFQPYGEMQSCPAKDIHSDGTCSMHRAKSTCTISTDHNDDYHSGVLEIVDDILTWVNDRGQERVCLLRGGQDSAMANIAWHITCLFNSTPRPCSLYSFRRSWKLDDQSLSQHPQDLFGDIAKHLASKYPPFGQVLATTTPSDYKTVDTQFEELILAPVKRMSDDGPVLVIIDALDECPEGGTRKSIVTALAGKAAELPENFRILVTCHYEKDVFDALRDKMHVLEKPFDMQC